MPQTFTLTPSDGSEPFALVVPTSWADVSTAQFLHLMAGTDTATPVVCVLTDLTESQWRQLAATDAVYLDNCLAFAADMSELLSLPEAQDMPDVGSSSWGKMLAAQQWIEAHPETSGFGVSAYLLALYTTPGDGSKDAWIETAYARIQTQPITETYPQLVFIWAAWQRFKSATPPTQATKPTTKTKKRKQALRAYLRGLVRSSRSIR